MTFAGVVVIFFLNIVEMDLAISLEHQWAWRNLTLWQTKGDGIDYLLMRFQLWSMFEYSRVVLLSRGSSIRQCLVLLNQGYFGTSQCNLLDSMLRLNV